METPDNNALEDFWHFINERQNIYLLRTGGANPPWTEDPILKNYRFCNVLRENDRGSKVLFNRLDQINNPGLIVYNSFLYRGFNRPETYEELYRIGYSHLYERDRMIEFLEDLRDRTGQSLYSSAYMLRGFGGKPKHVSIVEALGIVWDKRNALAYQISAGESLEKGFEVLLNANIPGWGEFTCYQVLLDLMHTPVLPSPKDVNTWCVFGPGAKAGLREIWPTIRLREQDMIPAAKTLWALSKKYVQSPMRSLNLQDIEFCLCELAKYRKIKRTGKGRRKYQPSNVASMIAL